MDLLNANEVSISQSCGGNGTCTTCRVEIYKGARHCSPRSELEIERSEERHFGTNERLACQTEINGSIEIDILNGDEAI